MKVMYGILSPRQRTLPSRIASISRYPLCLYLRMKALSAQVDGTRKFSSVVSAHTKCEAEMACSNGISIPVSAYGTSLALRIKLPASRTDLCRQATQHNRWKKTLMNHTTHSLTMTSPQGKKTSKRSNLNLLRNRNQLTRAREVFRQMCYWGHV